MSLITWILIGGIAGWLASLLLGDEDQKGCITNIVVGMIGSLVGGAIVVLLQGGSLDLTTAFTQFNLTSLLVSTIGAVVFLGILKLLRK